MPRAYTPAPVDPATLLQIATSGVPEWTTIDRPATYTLVPTPVGATIVPQKAAAPAVPKTWVVVMVLTGRGSVWTVPSLTKATVPKVFKVPAAWLLSTPTVPKVFKVPAAWEFKTPTVPRVLKVPAPTLVTAETKANVPPGIFGIVVSVPADSIDTTPTPVVVPEFNKVPETILVTEVTASIPLTVPIFVTVPTPVVVPEFKSVPDTKLVTEETTASVPPGVLGIVPTDTCGIVVSVPALSMATAETSPNVPPGVLGMVPTDICGMVVKVPAESMDTTPTPGTVPTVPRVCIVPVAIF